MSEEKVIVILKPDGVALKLRSTLINELLTRSLILEEEWSAYFDEKTVRQLYSSYQSAWFFSAMVEFLTSGLSLVMIWSGLNATQKALEVRGSSYNKSGIRGQWSSGELSGLDGERILLKNAMHVSDHGNFDCEYRLLKGRIV